MIRLKVNSLKFGNLGLKSGPYDAFEVICFKSSTNATPVARIEIEKSDFPELKLRKLDIGDLTVSPGSVATVETTVLGRWSDDVSTHFALMVSGKEDAFDIVLSGQRHRHHFLWRAQFKLVNGEVMIEGPSLAGDPDS